MPNSIAPVTPSVDTPHTDDFQIDPSLQSVEQAQTRAVLADALEDAHSFPLTLGDGADETAAHAIPLEPDAHPVNTSSDLTAQSPEATTPPPVPSGDFIQAASPATKPAADKPSAPPTKAAASPARSHKAASPKKGQPRSQARFSDTTHK